MRVLSLTAAESLYIHKTQKNSANFNSNRYEAPKGTWWWKKIYDMEGKITFFIVLLFALSHKTFFIHSQKILFLHFHKKLHIHLQKRWNNTFMMKVLWANAKFLFGTRELRDWWFQSSLCAGFSQFSCLSWQFLTKIRYNVNQSWWWKSEVVYLPMC